MCHDLQIALSSQVRLLVTVLTRSTECGYSRTRLCVVDEFNSECTDSQLNAEHWFACIKKLYNRNRSFLCVSCLHKLFMQFIWALREKFNTDVTSFFSHNKHNRCIYSRKHGNMNWFFRYWRILMQYFNLKISTTQPKITVIEYVTNRRSKHLQLNYVRLGQTVRFTKPQTKSESLMKN